MGTLYSHLNLCFLLFKMKTNIPMGNTRRSSGNIWFSTFHYCYMDDYTFITLLCKLYAPMKPISHSFLNFQQTEGNFLYTRHWVNQLMLNLCEVKCTLHFFKEKHLIHITKKLLKGVLWFSFHNSYISKVSCLLTFMMFPIYITLFSNSTFFSSFLLKKQTFSGLIECFLFHNHYLKVSHQNGHYSLRS